MKYADDLNADLDDLMAPGGGYDTTVPGTVTRPSAAPARGWEPGYKMDGDGGMIVTTDLVSDQAQGNPGAWRELVESLEGFTIPPGYEVELVEAKYDPGAWARDADDRGKPHTAYRAPVWRYRFRVVPQARSMHLADVDSIIAEAMRVKRKKKPKPETAGPRSLNVVYADPQAGKVALLGGTEQLTERFRDALDMLDDYRRDLKKVGRAPDTAAWLDGGDCIENFQSTKQQGRTNDLTMTQQVRVHRRLTYHGLDYLAANFNSVVAASCGSNHARERDGKDTLGPPDDDWGLEVLSQVQDGYSRNPDAFGHVKFAYPPAWRDSLCLDLGGLPVGLAHGHQVNRPEGIHAWWKGQAFGEQPVTHARVLVTGHFHHFAAKEVGNGRLWVQAPTIDNGSDWFTQRAGEVSHPGLLVFTTNADGWDDLRILRGDSAAWGRDAA